MKFFSDLVFKHICQELKQNSGAKSFFLFPELPIEITNNLGNELKNRFAKEPKIKLIFKIAEDLYKKWQNNENTNLDSFDDSWVDKLGNLTYYRNESSNDEERLILCLIGVNLITDSSSLEDFNHCNFDFIWNTLLNKSFEVWIEKGFRFKQISFEEDDTYVKAMDSIFQFLCESKEASIYDISCLIEDILKNVDIVNSYEAYTELLKNLKKFGYPKFFTQNFRSSIKPQKYMLEAKKFFSINNFLDKSSKNKILKKIKQFRDNDSSFAEEERGLFPSDEELLDGICDYVTKGGDDLKDKLLECDFCQIYNLIIKANSINGETRPKPPEKLKGELFEVVLTAIWKTLAKFEDEIGYYFDEIKEIKIYSNHFSHDLTVGLNQVDRNDYVVEYLKRLLGGVDDIILKHFNDELLPFSFCSQIFNENISQQSSRNTPFLEFSVIIEQKSKKDFKKKFKWVLQDFHENRLAKKLIESCHEILEKNMAQILPAFAIPHYNELFLTKDIDESQRIILNGFKDANMGFTIINLIEDISPEKFNLHSSLREVAELGLKYKTFISQAQKEGLYNSLLNNLEAWSALKSQYLKTIELSSDLKSIEDKAFCLKILEKAFLIIASRTGQSKMKMHNSEKSAVVSCLHPSVLEMIQARTLFLIHSILHLIKEQIRFKSKNGFNIGKWEIICDLASIDTPIVGLMSALSHDLITDGDGEGLLHKIGKPDPNSQILSAKAILQNHDFEDFDITSKELFKNSQDSKLIARIIKNYQRLHPHTNEGLTISFLQNRFLQHTIAAIDSFLDQRFLLLKKSKVSTSEAPFKLNLRIYSNAFDSSKFDNWLKNWEEEILSLQSRESDNRYKNVEISLAYKVYDIDHKGQSSLEKIMDLDGSADITFLDNFIREGFEKSDFEYLEDFDYRDFDIKFPILEKKLCNIIGIVHNTTQRRRIISNNQFYIQHKHIELLSALRNLNVNNSKDFPIVVNEGNYEPWIRVIDKFHLYSNWVVCIDPNIDEGLLKLTSNEKYPDRDIIGFGSGVGARGESNYTISCGQFQLKDVLQNLIVKTKSIFRDHWTNEFEIETFCNNVIKRSLMLSGLSLVKAVGFSEYARDLISYSMIHRFTEKAEEQICNILVSLDAYIHWFNNDDNAKRPDLLNIKVILKKNNTLKIKLGLIECKLAKYTDSHIIKAYQQIENGLRLLIPKFFPKPKNVADAKPDSKYWWLQLHRLISTKIRVNTIDKNKILVALANMEKGLFEIKWQAAILTFWCDKKESIVDYRQDNVNVANESVVLHVWQLGLNFIKDAFKDSTSFNIFAENQFFDNEPSFDDANNNDSANKIHNNFELPVKKKNIEKNDSSKEKNASNFQEAHEESSKLDLEETNKDDELISRSKKDKDFLCENYVINSDCRILLGQCPNSNRKIYWEFGHEDMQNRHLLIFGGSGSGKTYAIQALVLELSMQKIHSLIVDYTSSFTAKQLEKVFIEAVRPKQFYPLKKEQDKIPLNPFKLQTIDFGDGTVQDEEVSNVSNRVADILKKVFLLGDQQYSYIVQSVEEGLGSRPGNFDFQDLYESLAELDSSGKLSHKIAPFVNTKPFNFALANENWQYLFSNVDKYCNIFQLIGLNSNISRIIIEFVLWDLYFYAQLNGAEKKPKMVVLDEMQNLDHSSYSPMAKILTEGRKFGLNLILATQNIANFQKDETSRLFNASQKLFFKPTETEVKSYIKIISDITGDKQTNWAKKLLSLKQGECYAVGSYLKNDGSLFPEAVKIKINNLGSRLK